MNTQNQNNIIITKEKYDIIITSLNIIKAININDLTKELLDNIYKHMQLVFNNLDYEYFNIYYKIYIIILNIIYKQKNIKDYEKELSHLIYTYITMCESLLKYKKIEK